jgi:predicted DCC family thiol-disulfide oxidoreductase YuxK
MTTAWTGGQYSVLRFLLALATARVVLASDTGALVNLVALGLGVLLAVGARDRIAALALAVLAVRASPWASGVLVVHAALPAAPYGSWDARGRADPGDEWEMPPWVPMLAWAAVVVLHLVSGVLRLTGWEAVFGLGELGLLGLAAMPERRRWAWLGLTLLAIADNDPLGVLFIHAFAFDPGWIPASTRITPATIFYDGACGLCHRAVRFVLAEDRTGRLQLAPLQSAAFERLVPPEVRDTLPDSIVVRTADGELLARSLATIEIATALGGLWRVAATLFMLIPTELADRAYDFVAANRRRMFAPPDVACPLVPPRLRGRFVPDDAACADQPEPSAPKSARTAAVRPTKSASLISAWPIDTSASPGR